MRLSEEIRAAFATDSGTISFGEVLERVSQRSFGLLLLLFALPSALPVPAPGYSIPGGMALVVLGLQLVVLRKFPWLPQRVLNKRLPADPKSKMVGAMVRFIAFFERFVRPRFTFISTSKPFAIIMGGFVLLCGISMCIPLPLTNTVPAMGVFLIGLGMLEEDALFGVAGAGVAIAGLTVTVSLLVLIFLVGLNPQEAVEIVKNFIKSLLGSDPAMDTAG